MLHKTTSNFRIKSINNAYCLKTLPPYELLRLYVLVFLFLLLLGWGFIVILTYTDVETTSSKHFPSILCIILIMNILYLKGIYVGNAVSQSRFSAHTTCTLIKGCANIDRKWGKSFWIVETCFVRQMCLYISTIWSKYKDKH